MTASAVAAQPPSGMRRAARFFNPVILLLAGTRLLPLYGVIQHRGRKSGKVFRTPVVVRPAPDGFVVPMPWGEGTDWFRNIRAAGGCVIRWKGRDYTMVDPEVVDADSAQADFAPAMRAGIRRFGIKHVVRLRFARAGSVSRTVRAVATTQVPRPDSQASSRKSVIAS